MIAALCSCASSPPPFGGLPAAAPAGREAPQTDVRRMDARQRNLVAAGHDLVGRDALYVGGTRYNDDCTGTVLAVYAAAGINLDAHFERYTGSGVHRVYQMMQRHALYYPARAWEHPAPGDVVFFDNTFDRNGDERWNDELTHVGMVMAVAADGTISYVHNHIRTGVTIERMNLRHPDARALNAPMRQRGSPRDGRGRWLASHLVRGYGRGYLLPRSTG